MPADDFTFSSLINACAKAGALERAMEVHEHSVEFRAEKVIEMLQVRATMHTRGLEADTTTFTALIDGFCRAGCHSTKVVGGVWVVWGGLAVVSGCSGNGNGAQRASGHR